MENDRSPWSQHNVWRHLNLRYSKAGNSELETMTRSSFKIIRYYASSSYLKVLKGLNKKCRENLVNVLFSDAQSAANSMVSDMI